MAAFSLGKLDAICARLKSSQQPLPNIRSNNEEVSGISDDLCDSEKCNQIEWKSDNENGILEAHKADITVKDQLFSTHLFKRQPTFNAQKIVEVEKSKVQSACRDLLTNQKTNNYSLIEKHNNNNITEVTNYNDKITSLAQSATFQTADSTTFSAGPFISSITVERNLCKKTIPPSQPKASPSSSLMPNCCSMSVMKPETDKSLVVCSSPVDSLLAQNICCVSNSEKSQHLGMTDVVFQDHMDSDAIFATSKGQSLPARTLNQETSSGSNTDGEAQMVHRDIASDATVPSSISSSVTCSGKSSVHSLIVSPSENSTKFEQRSRNNSFSYQTAYEKSNFEKHSTTESENITISAKQHIPIKLENITNTEDMINFQEVCNNLFVKDEQVLHINSKPSIHQCSTFASVTGKVMPMLNTETQEPSSNLQSSQHPRSSPMMSSSARRKSRKSAKPQKQVTIMVYHEGVIEKEFKVGSLVDPSAQYSSIDSDILLDNSIALTELPRHMPSEGHNESILKEYFLSPPNLSSPLDLSLKNVSNESNKLSLERTFSILDSEVNSAFNKSESEVSPGIYGGNISGRTVVSSEKPCSQLECPDNRMLRSTSPPLEKAETKVLVDFAQNTMKELLGMYGFESPDVKNINLQNSLSNFQADKLTHDSGIDVDKSLISLVETDRRSTILNHHKIYKRRSAKESSINNTYSLAKNSSKQQNLLDTPQVTAGVARYALGKKLYKQKVQNIDFMKYIKRYDSSIDCGVKVCQDLGYRDHYHCHECSYKVFIRKEEMVRHLKWHKKRNDSLRQGFMRYSPLDDCSKKRAYCIHNGRQTHYHCVQRGCDKVYVSTSDVQMHANLHLKDSAIIQEGFQRFRATEDCGSILCLFYGMRTTHFHCRRPHCNFTFKNKADIEKHKSYHQKDEVLSRDGFKKFMKYEACPYAGCPYSKMSNHIHCIRPGCLYVLHSTAQLYSHKRKHEKSQFEHNNRQIQLQWKKSLSGPTINLEAGVKKSVSATSAVSSHTKVLPLPALAFSNGKKGLEITSAPSKSLISCLTTKSAPIQDLEVIDPLKLSKKAFDTASLKLVLQPTVDAGIAGAYNLIDNVKKTKIVVEELNHTLALPVKSFVENSGSDHMDLKLEQGCEDDSKVDEAKDLSLSTKKTQESFILKDESQKKDISFISETDSHSFQQVSETYDEDDDSDDDDDKDYGQLEEPTLVNIFTSGLEDNKLDDLLTQPVPTQDVEISRERNMKTQIDSSISLVVEPKSSEAIAHSTKSSSIASESFENMGNQKDQVNDYHFPQPQHSLEASGDILTQKNIFLGAQRQKRDELWKKYLCWYTANEECFPHCTSVYKDHYHCRVEGCKIVFKSKDEVRNHAKCHQLQDTLTPLFYLKYEPSMSCSSASCQYNYKETHYHCNWTSCTHVILASGPTFSRLEHYRTHQSSVGKNHNISRTHQSVLDKNHNKISAAGSGEAQEPLRKRRGRPPKNPKCDLPLVPKVHLTEKEILDSTLDFMHNKCSELSTVFNGFKKFLADEVCPDDFCVYKRKDHFHCGRKYCHMATDRLNFLNLHAQDFHNNVTILVGYEFFEKMVNCRRPDCQHNKVNRHFHCIRPHCDYSFVRHSTMTLHNKKHPTVTSTVLSARVSRSIPALSKVVPSQFVPIAPAMTLSSPRNLKTPTRPSKTTSSPKSDKTVKSSGTFFPLSGVSAFKVTSLATPSIASTQIVASRDRGSTLSIIPLTSPSACPSKVITVSQVSQVFQSTDGLPAFPSATLVTVPHSIVARPIPIITQTSQGQQTNVFTGIIPLRHLSQHSLTTPLVGITAGQLIATSQDHVLHNSRALLGKNVLHVIPNQTGFTTQTTTTPVSFSTSKTPPTAAMPITDLLQRQDEMGFSLTWASLKKRMLYSVLQNCGRPFCKLKKKDHYHCLDCNQAFSDPSRLRVHVGKHGFKFKRPEQKASQLDIHKSSSIPRTLSLDAETKGDSVESKIVSIKCTPSSTLILQPPIFTNIIIKQSDSPTTNNISTSYVNGGSQSVVLSNKLNVPSLDTKQTAKLKNKDENNDRSSDCKNDNYLDSLTPVHRCNLNGIDESSLDKSVSTSVLKKSVRKRKATKSLDCININSLDNPAPAKQKTKHSDIRSEINLPDGYKRVRCGEDCDYVRCAYRQTVTHFHCLRTDCGYGFSDKSRISQHHLRHERLDALMGGEFQQFRASATCEWKECEFSEKSSHFHCLKCRYTCADSSKVPAHRKHHSKLDIISSQGFIKYSGTVICESALCPYYRKQTHYHCTFPGCNQAVLGPSQMTPHKLKHAQHHSL